MKNSSLTAALTFAALLGGGLMVPAAASAHDGDRGHGERTQYSQRGRHNQHEQHRDHHAVRQHYQDHNWYLQRHREVRPLGYYPQPHLIRMHRDYQPPRHQYDEHHQHEQRDTRLLSPVRLQIGYEIVL
jgi:hypothetical protein